MEYLVYLIVIGLSLIYYFKHYWKSVYLAMTLKGPPALPILGNVLLLNDSEKLVEYGTNAYQMYGPFMRCWISIVPFIFIYEPKHLKLVLGSNKISKKNVFYRIIHNFVGEGLVTNNGSKWKKSRRLLQPYFHINMLESYIKIFTENAQEFLLKLSGHKELNIVSFINNCILEILHKAVLGVPLDKESPYRKGQVILNERVTKPWLLLETFFKHTLSAEKEIEQKFSLHNYTKKILLERKEQLQTSPITDCLLDVLIEISKTNSEFTDEDVINEAVTFMLAGQDSVGAAIAFTSFFLAKHENIQNKVVEEIRDIKDGTSEMLTLTDLNNMKYLEQVIKESLRLTPSIPIISRILTEDVILDGKNFAAGTNVFISPFITHRLPHLFPEPLKFNPDRFSQENLEKLHPYAFIPFSVGPRNCIGYKFAMLEMKTIIFYLLKRYTLCTIPGFEDVKLTYRATLRAKGGIRLRLNPRE